MKRQWKLLLNPPLDAVTNMAIDSYLFRSHQLGDPPTLRLYSWLFPSISIGVSQQLDPSFLWKYRGWSFVRRLTGGGMVFHGKDLTYSVVFDAQQHWIPYPVRESYLFFHALVAEALGRMGLSVKVSPSPKRGEEGVCFSEPVEGDLLFRGKKIAGGAQRRGRRKALHQGSIQIGKFRKGAVERLQRFLLEVFQERVAISFVQVEGFKQGGQDGGTRSGVSAPVGGGRLLGP